jgi:membrane protease YdiL (CAAX protease family)
VAGSVVASALAIAVYNLCGNLVISKVDMIESITQRGFTRQQVVPVLIYFVVINATMEELFWRGVIYNELRLVSERFRRVGVIWAVATFAAWHYLVLRLLLMPPFDVITVVVLVIFGLIMCRLYDKTGSIVLPILWHGLVCDFALAALLVYILQTT